LRRVEDRRFLLGRGRFVADIELPGALACVLVRSPHAHARIRRVGTAAAKASPGVVAVFTGADMAADAMAPMRPLWAVRSRDGAAMAEPPRFALARGTVRHGGEPVVAVIADTLLQATDAAERVEVDYEPLPAVTDARAAQAAGAPQLHQSAPGNVCFRWARGDEAAVRAAFASAPHVVTIDLVNNRLVGAAIEPRAAIATAEADGGRLTLYTSTQAPHHIRRQVTEQLGIPESALRVISPDVGGGFGYKGKLYPEEGIVAWAARRLGRPVRWVATRAESFVSDNQARDHLTHAQLALAADGRFLALHVRTCANLGAYVSTFGAAILARLCEPARRRLSHARHLRGKHRHIHQRRRPTPIAAGRPRPVTPTAGRSGRQNLAWFAARSAAQLSPARAADRRLDDCGDFQRLQRWCSPIPQG
jgi:carbon-monoxide dehydrogenase large subunit